MVLMAERMICTPCNLKSLICNGVVLQAVFGLF